MPARCLLPLAPGIALATTLLLASCAAAPVRRTADVDPTRHGFPSRRVLPAVTAPSITRPAGESAAWWFRSGAAEAAERGAMAGGAKNLILFVGDGMSLTTVAAARILAGQRNGAPGEEHRLAWERFPATALSRTYNVDAQTPDSAGTMSAMATGMKTRAGVLSIAPESPRGDCAAARATPALTLWELAAASGLATGIVTTTRITHATPAATFAHSADRDWETDADRPSSASDCADIARQWVETPFGDGPTVLLGGGRRAFLPDDAPDPEYPQLRGARRDGRHLIAEWQQRTGGHYAWNAGQLASAPLDGPLLGLFEPGHLHYEHDRPQDAAGEPSLADMTRAAIARLRRHEAGYVLLVEGGRIDHAHHAGNAFRALDETIALSEAVQAALDIVSPQDTLILVTADHAHTLAFSGYPRRGNPILGKVKGMAEDPPAVGRDVLATDALGLPYTTLSYANGPGYTGVSAHQAEGPKRFPHEPREYRPAQGRPDLRDIDTEAPDYLQEALLPRSSETHGGEDVGVWAIGPGSDAVRGSIEQHTVFHLMLQSTPALRAAYCRLGGCAPDGVPANPVPAASAAAPRVNASPERPEPDLIGGKVAGALTHP